MSGFPNYLHVPIEKVAHGECFLYDGRWHKWIQFRDERPYGRPLLPNATNGKVTDEYVPILPGKIVQMDWSPSVEERAIKMQAA